MAHRRIWVKRPDASATLVSMPEDSVVDELRDHVLRKYSNSLGRTFDSPDLMVRIIPRASPKGVVAPDRFLSPEESLFTLIDQHFPGGQTVEEALIIEAPTRRTPIKPSPRQSYYYHAEPAEHGEYFPLMPVPINVGTPPGHPASSSNSSAGAAHQAPAMSVLTTGKVPPLPSPGSRPSRHPRRPPFARHTTASPTLVAPSMPKGMSSQFQITRCIKHAESVRPKSCCQWTSRFGAAILAHTASASSSLRITDTCCAQPSSENSFPSSGT